MNHKALDTLLAIAGAGMGVAGLGCYGIKRCHKHLFFRTFNTPENRRQSGLKA